PLIYQENIYLVYKLLDKNYLLALDFKGNKLTQKNIGEGTIERSPVISRNGIFYIVTGTRIAAYDLNRGGELFASSDVPGKLSNYTDLTIGNDGSLFLAALDKDNVNYIYGFTADLKPFLKSSPFSKEQEKISTVTVSTDGKKIFAQIPRGAVVIDIANPSEERITALQNGQRKPEGYYHVPIAAPTECMDEKDQNRYMIFSDFANSANRGNVWGYTSKENRGSETTSRLWSSLGTLVPQPVLGSNRVVYFIQDGKLQRHEYCETGSGKTGEDEKLNTTSNLVMDGDDNIYFWDSGVFRGYNLDGVSLFGKTDSAPDLLKPRANTANKDEPEQFIRLMAGPDGTLWANNQGASSLYAFKPTYAKTDLSLGPDDLKPTEKNPEAPRAYRTTGELTVGNNVSLGAGTNTLFQAQKSIAFGNGFTVEK